MRIKRLSALAGVAALVAMLFTGASVSPASAAPIKSSCGYADADGGGLFPGSICWLDFTGYDPAVGVTAAGQQFEMTLGAYDVSYTVTQRTVPGGWSARSVVAAAATVPPFILGVPGYYNGIPGRPFLYSTSGQPFGAVQINVTDFQISLNGTPVTGYDLITASPETPDALVGQFGEYINWTSDAPLTMIDSRPPGTNGGACAFPLAGNGTTNVWCNPGTAGSPSVLGAILSAPSATNISGTLYMYSRGEREGLGFGIRTATVSLDKQVDSRLEPADSFDLSITSSEGPQLAAVSTGAEDTATTEVVPVIPSGPVTLAESMSSGSPSLIDYYDASWTCANATATSPTVLPSGASPSQSVTLVAGDVVSCEIVNTAKVPSLDLVKSVSPLSAEIGDTVVYDFAVTNDGALPVENLVIDETAFSGSDTLGTIDCPVTELAVGASTTCQASYVVTQADADAGLVTNEATAAAQVTGTTVSAASDPSTADLTVNGESALAVTKSADLTTAEVGDEIVYTLTATNTGALTLHDVTLSDEEFTGSGALEDLSCDQPARVALAPGETLTCTATYQVLAGDVGTITNDVVGTAIDPRENTLTGTDSATVAVTAVAVVVVPPGAALALTGADLPWLLGGLGLLLLIAGVVVLAVRRARNR